MKNFNNCEPYQLQRDLRELIKVHKLDEQQRRIIAEIRLQKLENQLDEVTIFIASHIAVGGHEL